MDQGLNSMVVPIKILFFERSGLELFISVSRRIKVQLVVFFWPRNPVVLFDSPGIFRVFLLSHCLRFTIYRLYLYIFLLPAMTLRCWRPLRGPNNDILLSQWKLQATAGIPLNWIKSPLPSNLLLIDPKRYYYRSKMVLSSWYFELVQYFGKMFCSVSLTIVFSFF